jgi:hypothetical protein
MCRAHARHRCHRTGVRASASARWIPPAGRIIGSRRLNSINSIGVAGKLQIRSFRYCDKRNQDCGLLKDYWFYRVLQKPGSSLTRKTNRHASNTLCTDRVSRPNSLSPVQSHRCYSSTLGTDHSLICCIILSGAAERLKLDERG